MMQQVICISKRKNSNQIEIGNIYYIDLMSVCGDSDGDWYGEVYADEFNEADAYVGRMKLSHFKSAI